MSPTREKSQLMSASEIDRTLVRLAHEILEKTKNPEDLVFIGIRRRGVPLAQRLARKIEAIEGRRVPVGILDIQLYRDDLSTVGSQPVVSATDIPFTVAGKDVILTDERQEGAVIELRLRRARRWRRPPQQEADDDHTDDQPRQPFRPVARSHRPAGRARPR